MRGFCVRDGSMQAERVYHLYIFVGRSMEEVGHLCKCCGDLQGPADICLSVQEE